MPNVAQVGHVDRRRTLQPARPPLVVGMGRVCAQKDPAWFADAVGSLRPSAPDLRFLWIGGGAPGDERVLRRTGVELTGWCDRTVGLETLARADCYLHSAAWEGFPMTVLEAVGLGVPVVVRRLPSEPGTPAVATAADPAHAARLVHGVLTDGDRRRANLAAWRAFLQENERGTQSERLALAYGTGQRAGRTQVRPRSLAVAVTEGLEQGLRAVSLLSGGAGSGRRWI
ncbi:glycosyltransferase [Georgenia sp. SUBG003]|uniref:glycosyltransferase n=1 Tax=Georgenia sp. SUBG003 TaxID=1497974 RepID=UPI000693E801